MADSMGPREVLLYLNSLGYKNITAEHLKEFMKDLKRLMKYESRYSNVPPTSPKKANLPKTLNKHKHKASQEKPKTKPLTESNNIPRTIAPTYPKSPTSKRLVAERDTDPVQIAPHPSRVKFSNASKVDENRLISEVEQRKNKSKVIAKKTEAERPLERKSTGKKECKKLVRNTPTDLFQKYQEDWIKYKHLLPGENSRDDVRQMVRKKLLRKPEDDQKVYLCFTKDDHKIIKRI